MMVLHVSEKLQVITFGNTRVIPIADLPSPPNGTAWISEDEIVYATFPGELFRVRIDGSKPQLIASPPESPEDSKQSYLYPETVPGKDILLYTVFQNSEPRIEARSLAGGRPSVVVENASFPKVTTAGHLLFVREGRLMAAELDGSSRSLASQPVTLDEDLGPPRSRGSAPFDVAHDGTFVSVAGTEVVRPGRFVWKAHEGGSVLGQVGPPGLDTPRYPRLSHDNRRLAATIGPPAPPASQIWVFDLVGLAPPLKLTLEGHNIFPMWTKDDRSIVFFRTLDVSRPNSWQIVRLPADGTTFTPEVLVDGLSRTLGDLSIDDMTMVLQTGGDTTSLDVSLLKLGSNERPVPWLNARFAEGLPRFSSNGRWVAYQTNQTGIGDIWVRPFPGPGAPVGVSAGGGLDPVWSHDGRELYYQNDGQLVAVPLTPTGTTLVPGAARTLFEGGFLRATPGTPRTFDVARDGRFLMIDSSEAPGDAGSVTVVIGFDALVRTKIR
jgi:serine/threonine-protein kinase